jgi:hypothetical protein
VRWRPLIASLAASNSHDVENSPDSGQSLDASSTSASDESVDQLMHCGSRAVRFRVRNEEESTDEYVSP